MLSHHTALSTWRLAPEADRVHVSVDARRRAPARARLLTVHRVTDLSGTRVHGLPVPPPARTLVDAWGQAHGGRRSLRFPAVARAAVITAVRTRRTGVPVIRRELDRRPELPGRAALSALLVLVEGGSQSELEIRGMEHVLAVPGLPPCRQQHRVTWPGGVAFLDAAWPEVLLAVGLDGAAFHGSAAARERDLRRDAALAGRDRRGPPAAPGSRRPLTTCRHCAAADRSASGVGARRTVPGGAQARSETVSPRPTARTSPGACRSASSATKSPSGLLNTP